MTEEVVQLTEELAGVRRSLDLILERLTVMDRSAKKERRRAWWHRGVSVALVLIVIALGVIAWQQYRQRTANCEAITEAFDTYTEALAAFSTAGSDRNPEEQDRFDARVDVFRAEIATRLADCK